VLVLLAANVVAAGDEVTRVAWSELTAQGRLEIGEIVASASTTGSDAELRKMASMDAGVEV